MSRLNGRPEAEVIINFQDGLSYSKNRMDEAIATGIFESVPKEKEVNKNKKEDVDLIVHELEIPRPQAEKALTESEGDVAKALRSLITPPSSV